MSDTIRIKRRAAGGSAGAPSTLANAELAFNEQDLTLYYGIGTGGTGGSATSAIPIAGTGAFVDKGSAQSISGVKTYTVSPQAPTPTAGDNSTNVATTAFVTAAVGGSGGTQAPNYVYAGPASGGTAATPTFRALVAADIPTLTSTKISDFSSAADARITAQKNVALGLCPLDGSAFVPLANLPASVRNPMSYAGTWNASTNTPTLTSGSGTKGSVYKVTTAGGTNLDGNTQWNVGDEAVFNGATWDKWDGLGSEVLSVNGAVGAVVLTSDNVSEGTTNLYFTAARVLAVLLTGLSTATNAAITATDSILIALGKLQAQVTARLIAANNLSDLTNAGTARTNLGLGTAATLASSAVAQTANNLSDLASASTARTNLGLGSAALLSSAAVAQTANNLSDLASAPTARTNLGLGTMSTQNASAVVITGGTIDGVTFDGGSF